mgnify:CR=1 FL=1
MMSKFSIKDLAKYIPDSREGLDRLFYNKGDLKIAVFGKYNHGKSTLLNALIGKDVFKTADKRETIENSECDANGLVWVDTPGLDADVKGNDDRIARKGALMIADVLLLVHNVQAGELDKYELALYDELMKQDRNYKNKMFIVLTQIDQLSPNDLAAVVSRIKEQIPTDMKILPVSAVRYIKGIYENKEQFVALSGFDDLLSLVEHLKTTVGDLRNKEAKRLADKAIIEMVGVIECKKKELASAKYQANKRQKDFAKDLQVMNDDIQQYKENV